MSLIDWAERGWLPDVVIRAGIRRLLARRLRQEDCHDPALRQQSLQAFVDQLRAGPLAVATAAANEQHYEVPTEFFQHVLGPHMKYSCCEYAHPAATLPEAEVRMLDTTCQRAELADGMEILELGCGWGSLSLWMAQHFPAARILAVSNSRTQREFIEAQCRLRGITNLGVLTCDIREFDAGRQFDRVVSIEMFEHLRNYALLFRRSSQWLRPGGKLFAHIFCHRYLAYEFEARDAADWMARHFFTGGIMPSADLLLRFQEDLVLERQWSVNGRHYARTCDDWLASLDRRRDRLLAVLAGSPGDVPPAIALQRWRMFFMACAELFRYRGGNEWYVCHYRFRSRT